MARQPSKRHASEREIEVVLTRLRVGSIKATAAELGLTEQTIKAHLSHLAVLYGTQNFMATVLVLWPQIKDRVVVTLTTGETITFADDQ